MVERELTRPSAIHRLRVLHTIPAGLPRPGDALDAVAAAVGTELPGALADRFGSGAEALWVIRRLEVDVVLPASLGDPAAIAARLAAAVEAAIAEALRGEATCVRFDSAAALAAAFVQASVDAAEGSWVFERLAPARGLPLADTLLTAPRLAGTDLVDVVTELARLGTWERVVLRLAPGGPERVAAALLRTSPPAAAAPGSRAAVPPTGAGGVGRAGTPTATTRSLLALGRALLGGGHRAALVAEVLGGGPAMAPEPAGPVAADAPTRATPAATGDAASGPSVPTAVCYRAAGAAAAVLATSLPTVSVELELPWLVEAGPGAGEVRAGVLALVLGIRPDDLAVRLVAGAPRDPFDHADLIESTDLGERAVRSDDELWFAASDGDPGLWPLAAVLGRGFLRRLVGFVDSPLAYVVPRLFGPAGTVTVDDAAVTFDIERPPLLVVLQLAGLADFVAELPWADRPFMVRHEAGG